MCCSCMNRREFLGLATAAVAGAGLASSVSALERERGVPIPDDWDPQRRLLATGESLRIQPVLMYGVSHAKQATSWRSWGGVQSDQSASEEADRIGKELREMSAGAGFAMEILPVIKVKAAEDVAPIRRQKPDAVVLYPATGSGRLLQACMGEDGNTVIFVRHRSGPVYYWYEALSVKYLRTDESRPADAAAPAAGGVSVHDVVVDDYRQLAWRLRALHGVKNYLGTRIVALGGAMGKYAPDAPALAHKRHGIEIIEVGYDVLEPRLRRALADNATMARAERWTDQYLSLPGTTLATERSFLVNAFVLCGLFKELMREHRAPAFTIKDCMSTIMPMARTTACLTLSLMNDEGLLAFCESDFVVIPAGILLHYVSGKPVFMHNSTFPHDGIVTCAHCTGPRRMDGARYEPARIVTHYESDYGAAPKVEMPKGQVLTFIDPEYSTGRWLGFRGKVEGNPFYEICRSQQDVEIQGRWTDLIREVRDSHWMMVYGDYLKEAGYAARKIGIRWDAIE